MNSDVEWFVFPCLRFLGEAAKTLTLEVTLFVGKHCVTNTEIVCKDTVVLLKFPLKKKGEFRNISLRAANLVVKAFDQPRVSSRTLPSLTHTC